MSQFLSQAFKLARFTSEQLIRCKLQFNCLPGVISSGSSPTTAIPNSWSMNIARERYTYRQNETKRVKKFGFHAKIKTRNGRLQIMRRILKGRYVLTH